MLGFIGFTIAALIISFFAISFYVSFKNLNIRQKQLFSGAFLLLGLALLTWGFIPLLNTEASVAPLIFAGDALLIIGTCFLIAAQTKAPQLWLTIVLAIGATALLTARAYVTTPEAFVQNDILHFNLEGTARYVVIALLAFVWVPFGTRITQLAVRSTGELRFGGAIATIYLMSLICAALFISARQEAMIIATFAALSFTFLILSFIPILIKRYTKILAKAAVPKESAVKKSKKGDSKNGR